MTSLDASALTSDPEGLALLRAVLGGGEAAPPSDAFSPDRIRIGWTVSAPPSDAPDHGVAPRLPEIA